MNKRIKFKDGTELENPEIFYTNTGFYFDKEQVSRIAMKSVNEAIQSALENTKVVNVKLQDEIINTFLSRGIYKTKEEVINAALSLLVEVYDEEEME